MPRETTMKNIANAAQTARIKLQYLRAGAEYFLEQGVDLDEVLGQTDAGNYIFDIDNDIALAELTGLVDADLNAIAAAAEQTVQDAMDERDAALKVEEDAARVDVQNFNEPGATA